MVSDIEDYTGLLYHHYFTQKINNAVLFVPINNSSYERWVYDENSRQFQDVNFLSNKKIINIKSSANYFYMATKNNIYKVDYNLDYIELLNINDYDIYNMGVNDNEVIFNALRNSDGKVVIGIIASDGTVEILDYTLNKQVNNIEFL
jgi:hypothetical protein